MPNFEIFDNIAKRIKVSTKFIGLYDRLLKHQYPDGKQDKLEFDDIKFLLQSASIFSHSSIDEFKHMSYKIASIISLNYSDQYDKLNQIVQYIFISLGQIPVVRKNTTDGNPDYFSFYEESEVPFNPIKFRDVIFKQVTNQIPIEFDNKAIYLTDFQSNLFSSLDKGVSVSVSAPTSSGKSFLLKAFISKKFKENASFNVVYIVPTRALISETTRDFKNSFRHFGVEDVSISSAPSSYSKENTIPKKMFVLTQERYHILLYDMEFAESINVLIVDEAQNVADGARGITLDEVIDESVKRFKNLQIIFISPFSKNPEKFAEMFGLKNLKVERTDLSPVSQNLFFVKVDDEKYDVQLSTSELPEEIPIAKGVITEKQREKFKDSDKDWKLLWTTEKFATEFNIIYCNSTNACLKNAQIFASLLPEIDDAKINDAVKFLKENIHKDYYLIDCLKKGMAYHYGKMPTQIRNIIEHLFIDRKLNFVFCTTTLLEGVNFPVQNIFVKNPKIGTSSMTNPDFWNLAGRAGRLLKDYYGNVYCINVEDWKNKPDPKNKENEIESILENTFIEKDKDIMQYLKGAYFTLKRSNKHIEQAVAKFIIQDLKTGKVDFINFLKRNPNFEIDKMEAIIAEIEKLSSGIKIPAEILQKNSSIDPRKLQNLLDYFEKNDPIIPSKPTDSFFYDNLQDLYGFINDFFYGTTSKSYKYHTFLTYNWIKNNSLKEIIRLRQEFLERENGTVMTPEMINKEIENIFDLLNNKIRFDYQHYLKCYIDILLYYYESCHYDAKLICDNLPIYIEFGSYKKNVILLQSIGLSRSTSILIDSVSKTDFSDERDCLYWLKINKDFLASTLPKVCYDEVNELI